MIFRRFLTYLWAKPFKYFDVESNFSKYLAILTHSENGEFLNTLLTYPMDIKSIQSISKQMGKQEFMRNLERDFEIAAQLYPRFAKNMYFRAGQKPCLIVSTV